MISRQKYAICNQLLFGLFSDNLAMIWHLKLYPDLNTVSVLRFLFLILIRLIERENNVRPYKKVICVDNELLPSMDNCYYVLLRYVFISLMLLISFTCAPLSLLNLPDYHATDYRSNWY